MLLLQLFRAQFTDNTDFKFDLDGSTATTGNGGGSAQTLSAAQLPSLTGEEVAMVKLVLEVRALADLPAA